MDHLESEAVPLEPDRRYDLPGGQHLGRAAALCVPCSSGRASYEVLDREEDETRLMEAEPRIEPSRQMEAGITHNEDVARRLAPLFSPLRPRWPAW